MFWGKFNFSLLGWLVGLCVSCKPAMNNSETSSLGVDWSSVPKQCKLKFDAWVFPGTLVLDKKNPKGGVQAGISWAVGGIQKDKKDPDFYVGKLNNRYGDTVKFHKSNCETCTPLFHNGNVQIVFPENICPFPDPKAPFKIINGCRYYESEGVASSIFDIHKCLSK